MLISDTLGLAGHDSELFSFLPESEVDTLTSHPASRVQLWTFGCAAQGILSSVCYWHGPGCLAFTSKPHGVMDEHGWMNYQGYLTNDSLVKTYALVLVRYLFAQGYSCLLDDRPWITDPADPTLERLRYIRGFGGCSTDSYSWAGIVRGYCDWTRRALDRVDAIMPF